MEIYNILLEYKKNNTTIKSHIKSSESKNRATVRGDDVPQQIVHDGHIYKFYYTTKDSHIYICKYGINHHKTNPIKCNAKISIENPIILNESQHYQIKIIDSKHSCIEKTGEVKRMISNAFLKAKVEEIFMEENSPPTRQQVITKLYEHIEKTTPEGEEKQTFSELLVNNYYSELVKKYKQKDSEFSNVLKTARNDNFELFKYRFSNDHLSSLIICYCSDFQKECISQSRFIFIDGTFNITPKDFAQVLVILGQTKNMNLPLAYFLLPDKKQETYERAFTMFKNETKASFYPGATFVTDFEKAEYKAVKKCLMENDHYLQLCYFHFCQSMRRFFQKCDKIKIQIDLNSIANLLPFIPENKVIDVIQILYNFNETKKFAKYFENNYLNKYSFIDWSVYPKPRKETITNNVAESHNNILSKRIGIQPSLQKFESILVEIEKEYYYRYENRTYTPPEIMRIDEDLFDEKFRIFMSKLRRLNANECSPDSSEWFKNPESETSEDSEISYNPSSEIIPNDTKDEVSENSYNHLSDIIPNYSKDSNPKDFDPKDSYPKDSDPKDYDENSVEKIVETFSDNITIQGDKNPKQNKSKVNTRKLSDDGKQILLKNSKLFNSAKPRSLERKQILESTFNDLQDIEPNIAKAQVRSWFNNNKDKSLDS